MIVWLKLNILYKNNMGIYLLRNIYTQTLVGIYYLIIIVIIRVFLLILRKICNLYYNLNFQNI